MPRAIRTLSENEFTQTVSRMRMSKENVDIVKKVLVEGIPVSAVAKETDSKSFQAIEKAVRRVWCKFLDLQVIPEGWMTIRVSLPVAEALQIKAREQALKQQWLKDRKRNR